MRFLRIIAIIFVSLFPLYVVRFSLFGLPTTLLEVGFVVFFLIWLIETFKDGKLRRSLRSVPLKIPLMAFLCISFAAVFVSYDAIAGLGVYRAYFLEPVLLFVILTDLYGRKIVYLTDTLLGFAVSAFYLSILAITQYWIQVNWFAPHEVAAGRVSGLFNSANALSMYLELIVLSLAVVVLNDFKFSFRVLFFVVTLVLSVISILLSNSKGGLIALFGLCVFVFIRAMLIRFDIKKKIAVFMKNWFILLVLCLSGITGVFLFIAFNLVDTLPQERYVGQNTFVIRMIVWTGTMDLISDNLVLGAGLGGFKGLYSSRYLPVQYDEHLQYPHNIFLNFWSEIGILGLLVFIWINHLLIRHLRSSSQQVCWIVSGVIFLIFVHGIVDVPYFKNDLSMEFWAFASLVYFKDRRELNG